MANVNTMSSTYTDDNKNNSAWKTIKPIQHIQSTH